ncbi:hypothetical protein [Nocardia sp. bgisy118]|uniref:hypothetical protein n=1 Tax=Nocardia sp. bgisy118 TaxID=3413786 RepID=UPI003F4A1F6A
MSAAAPSTPPGGRASSPDRCSPCRARSPSAASAGPHALIRDGHARLITHATQVIDDLHTTPGI